MIHHHGEKREAQKINTWKVNHILEQIGQIYDNFAAGIDNSEEQIQAVVADMKTITPAEMKRTLSYYIVCGVLFCQFMSILGIACF